MQLTDSQNQVKKYVLGKYWRPIVAVFNISLSSTSFWLILLTFIFFAWNPIPVKVTWKDFQEFAFWILQVGTSLRNSNSFWSSPKKNRNTDQQSWGVYCTRAMEVDSWKPISKAQQMFLKCRGYKVEEDSPCFVGLFVWKLWALKKETIFSRCHSCDWKLYISADSVFGIFPLLV